MTEELLSFEVHYVRAFTQLDGSHGNPAGVVILRGPEGALPPFPSASTCQAVAAEVGLPETTFVRFNPDRGTRVEGADWDFQVRWFTPTSEVELCGHATVALCGHLHSESGGPHALLPGRGYSMKCNCGLLRVTVEASGALAGSSAACMVRMAQNLPHFAERVPAERVAASLGVPEERVFGGAGALPEFAPQVVSTGGRDLMVLVDGGALKGLDILREASLGERSRGLTAAINRVSQELDLVGYHLVGIDDAGPLLCLLSDPGKIKLFPRAAADSTTVRSQSDLGSHAETLSALWKGSSRGEWFTEEVFVPGVRNLAPFVGVPEEPATGSANGALACFLTRGMVKGLLRAVPDSESFESEVTFRFLFEQGREIGSPSLVSASVRCRLSNADTNSDGLLFVGVTVAGMASKTQKTDRIEAKVSAT